MDKETIQKENRLVANEWKEFSKTTAYRKLMEYIDFQDKASIFSAKGPVMTFDDNSGAQVGFDPEKASYLLQRSVMCDIIRMYVESYVNFTTKS